MADLTSCYFCGTIGELREHPVIPEELHPGDAQRTVQLCPTCREKLGTVLEPTVDLIEADRGTLTPSENGDGASETGSPDEHGDAAGTPSEEGDGSGTDKALSELVEDESDAPKYTQSRGAGYRWEPGKRARDAAGTELPDGTRRMARLLDNRDFPVDRAEIVDIAAGAYDLEPEECSTVVDRLVEEGYLRERNGSLYRTD